MKLVASLIFLVVLVGCGSTATAPAISPAPEAEGPEATLPQISTEVGAGGSGVLCDKGPKAGYFEVLDVYEARKRGMAPELGATNLPVFDKIEIALKRLQRLSPLRAEKYRKRAVEIRDSARYFTKGAMPHIGDDDPADLEDGCRLVQIATRKKKIFENDPEFMIDAKLFGRLDNDNQAALFLHEVAYEEASIEYGQLTSRPARGFTSTFFSSFMDKMTFPQFVEFLAKVDFKRTDYGGIQVPTKLGGNGEAIAGTLRLEEGKVKTASWEVSFQRGDFFIPHQAFTYFGQGFNFGGGIYQEALFSPDEKLLALWGHLSSGSEIEDRGNTLNLAFTHDATVTTFDDQGRFQLVTVAKDSQIRVDGEIELRRMLEKETCVTFAPDGLATSFVEGATCGIEQSPIPLPKNWK